MQLSPEDKELLRRALEKVAGANATIQFLSDYFRDKYGLTPQHQITPDGTIVVGTLSGLSGVPPSENGRNSPSDDLRTMQSEVAVSGETHGD